MAPILTPVHTHPSTNTLLDRRGRPLAEVKLPDARDEITTAVNNHDALAAALRVCRAKLQEIQEEDDGSSEIRDAIQAADTALRNCGELNPFPKSIYVVVNGGVVTDIYTNTPGADAEVLDFDNADTEEAKAELTRAEAVLVHHTYPVAL